MLRVVDCFANSHNTWLVLLAAVICVSGSAVAIRLFTRALTSDGTPRTGWLFLSGVAGGASIWTTHFIAMLAFRPSMPASYEITQTILSLLIAIGMTTLGLATAVIRARWSAAVGGAVVGLGIASMHYTGMAAYRTIAHIHWDQDLVAVSVVIGVLFGALASITAVRTTMRYPVVVATALLTAAICGLHFTAMAAAQFTPDPMLVIPLRSMSSEMLGGSIALVAFLVMGTGLSSYLIDERSRLDAQIRLHHVAHHDALTGLPNHAAFAVLLDQAIVRARRDGAKLGVLALDINRFKEINDVFGHRAGDRVLAEVARGMSACLRKGEFLARFGGDEFVAIQTSPNQPADTSDLAQRLVAAVHARVTVEGCSTQLGVSIGVTVFSDDGDNREELLVNAKIAMDRAKSGGQSVCFYAHATDDSVRLRRQLSQELAGALDNQELEIFYQAEAKTVTGEICGFEALLRWHHPKRGLVPPADFIPLAEESGLILPIGEWVLRAACREAASWDRPYRIAVNLSPVQLSHGNLPEFVQLVLLETGLSPTRLELEITESTLMANPEQTAHILGRLQALGVTVAMDDFGTGYSSLSMLQRFPFDKIKLDRSFLNKFRTDHHAAAIVRAVLSLGKSLSIPVLAEGVETEEHLAFLRAEHCDEVQGYLLGRPAPASAIHHLVFPTTRRVEPSRP
jgi:diguanylate cyclase (GGDEF)-like protein